MSGGTDHGWRRCSRRFSPHSRSSLGRGDDFRKSALLTTWTISGPETCKWIRFVLDSCGINSASIYPDLDGLARHIYWRYRRGMSQTKLQAPGRATDAERGSRRSGRRRKASNRKA